jgi:hypothetical protein
MILPIIKDTDADTLVAYYKNPTAVDLPANLAEIARQVAQIKQLFADKWKRRDIVVHLSNEWGLDERTAYNRINIAVRCFPDITEAYIDFEIQLLLDYQLDTLHGAMDDPKLFLGIMKERRLLLSFLKNKVETKDMVRTPSVVNNYIVIQNKGGQPTMVSEHEMASMDIEGRNMILEKATLKMLPEKFIDLLPEEEKKKHKENV